MFITMNLYCYIYCLIRRNKAKGFGNRGKKKKCKTTILYEHLVL